MRDTAKFATAALPPAALFCGMKTLPGAGSVADEASIELGKEIAYDRSRGNDVACHDTGDGVSLGSIGRSLIAIKVTLPERDMRQAQLRDSANAHPGTQIPLFSRRRALSFAEIDATVGYLHTL